MLRYNVVPYSGVEPVRLGMSPAEVQAAMGNLPRKFKRDYQARYETDAYHGSSFQVFYDGDEPKVDYIELSRNVEFFSVFYKEIDVFNTLANDVVALISKETPFAKNDPELGYSYIFPELELGLWRPSYPEAEKNKGEEMEPEDFFFSAIGIGIKGYYSAEPRFYV